MLNIIVILCTFVRNGLMKSSMFVSEGEGRETHFLPHSASSWIQVSAWKMETQHGIILNQE